MVIPSSVMPRRLMVGLAAANSARMVARIVRVSAVA